MDISQVSYIELDAERIDEKYMHIYRTMHALFHIDLEGDSAYTLEELSIEGV